MIHSRNLIALTIGLLLTALVSVAPLRAQDAELARKFMEELNNVAHDCMDDINERADKCADRVERMMARGQVRRAVSAAENCIAKINGLADDCVGDIETLQKGAHDLFGDSRFNTVIQDTASMLIGLIGFTVEDAEDQLLAALGIG